MFPGGLQQPHCAFHIRADERFRIGDGIVVMRFRGEVDYGVMTGHDTLQQRDVADVPHDKIDLRRWQTGDVLRIAGVRQLVEHGDVHMRMVPRHVSHEVRANEAASASHQNITRLEHAAARHAVHRSSIPSHANGWGRLALRWQGRGASFENEREARSGASPVVSAKS